MNNHEQSHANTGYAGGPPVHPTITNGVPPRPAVLELATWTWVTVVLLFWAAAWVSLVANGPVNALGLVVVVAFVALFGFGCWKFRSASNGWRVFFTILSGCYALLVPFGFFDPTSSLLQKALSVVIGGLAIAGLVCAWLPATNAYFRAMAQHRDAIKAQKRAEFLRNNPPPYGAQPQPGWQHPPNSA